MINPARPLFFIYIKDWSFRNATYYWNHTNDVWFQLAGNFQRFRKFNGDTVVLNEDLLYSPSALFKLNVAPCKDRGHAIVRRGKKKHYVGVRRYSPATFTFQFRECIYLQFPPGCCAIKAQIKQPCIWAEPLLFPCAPFGVSHNFTLGPKWWWIIHPGLFHLRLTKVVGGWWEWGGRDGGRFVRFRQTHFRPLTASRRFISQRRCRACRCRRRHVRNQSSRTIQLFH